MLIIFKKNYEIFNYISNRLKNDDDFLFEMLKYKPEILSESYLKNKLNDEFISKIEKLNLYEYLPKKLKKK